MSEGLARITGEAREVKKASAQGCGVLQEALDFVAAHGGPQAYLVADRFTVADLTAAAVLNPAVLPTEYKTPGVPSCSPNCRSGGWPDNIGVAYTSQQTHTMHSQGFPKAALTLDPAFSLLGALDVAGKNADTDSLGRRIARLRRDRGMTQVELADKLKVSQPVVSDYENDVIRLPADVVTQIAEILGVATDELLGRSAPAKANGGLKNRRLYRRLQEIEKLPKRDQQALLRTIEAFISKAG